MTSSDSQLPKGGYLLWRWCGGGDGGDGDDDEEDDVDDVDDDYAIFDDVDGDNDEDYY